MVKAVRQGTYLDQVKSKRSQFRVGRRAPIKPVIVVHTESAGVGQGSGRYGDAEAAAEIISGRNSPGSYHLLGDRASIVPLVHFDNEAYHDRTGSDQWAIAISLVMDAAWWPDLSSTDRDEFLDTAAQMAVMAARWLRHRGFEIPDARLLTKAESDQSDASGFISHARRDPSRRVDPGPAFPWPLFLRSYQQRLTDQGMDSGPDQLVRQLQRFVGVSSDGVIGPVTVQALNENWLGYDDSFDRSVTDRFMNNPKLVEWVQARINAHSDYSLAVDGVFGVRTSTAVASLLGRGGVVTADSYVRLASSSFGDGNSSLAAA